MIKQAEFHNQNLPKLASYRSILLRPTLATNPTPNLELTSIIVVRVTLSNSQPCSNNPTQPKPFQPKTSIYYVTSCKILPPSQVASLINCCRRNTSKFIYNQC